jgi:Tfp pilus assembly protein FimT
MKTYRNMNGFTLIEIIAILVILMIITAVALTQITSSQNNLIAATDTLTSHLRLAQTRAMNTYVPDTGNGGSVWGVNFTSSTQYYLFYCAASGSCTPVNSKVAFPGAGSLDITIVKVQVTNVTPFILAFDRFGTPYTDAKLTTILASQLTLTLKDNNGNTKTINIIPQTGMIKQG